MRLLFLSQELPPDTAWGGIGTYAGIITRALARRGIEVHALSVVPGQERSDEVRDGVHVHRAPLRRPRGVGRVLRLPETWDRLSRASAVAREARRLGLDFDVCESPEWGAEGLAIVLRGQTPLVVRLHSGAAQVLPHLGEVGVDGRLAIRAEDSLVRRADVVTGPRPIVAETAVKLGLGPERTRYISYPVPRPAPMDHTEDPARIVFAGRLEPRKGPDVLIRAAPRVLAQVPDARFVLFGADAGAPGGGSFRAVLDGLAADLGVTEAVEMPGPLPGPDRVAAEMARGALCAMPSRWESMGYVAAEAAAAGRPVVASRLAALEEIVEDPASGRLVPPEDPAALADAIVEVLAMTPGEREQMGVAGARLVADRCDPERVADQTVAAYELALSLRAARNRPRQ
jgi:glycosyltransferase involved in cell wall biosynthesis